MRKSIKIMLIVASSLVGFGILCMCISLMSGGSDMFKRAKTNYDVKILTATFDEVDAINIKDVSSDVRVIKSADNQVKVTYATSEFFTYYLKNIDGNLYIEYDDYRKWSDYLFGLNINDNDLIVEIPDKTLQELNIKTTSGDIEAKSVNALVTTLRATSGDIEVGGALGVLNASATSGDIKLNADITAQSVRICTTSGKLNISGVVEENVVADNTSGGIIINNIKCEKLDLNTTSGRIEGTNLEVSSLEGDAVSGKISFTNTICSGDVELDATSGNISITNIDAQNYYLNTTSGYIDAEILTPKAYNIISKNGSHPANTGGENGTFNAKTVSGSVDVEVVDK